MSSPTSAISSQRKIKLLQAGAGAGKTTRLTSEVFDFYHNFVSQHGREPNIVVTTFTRKATQEIRERLLKLAIKKEDQNLVRYISGKQKLFVTTMHGLMQAFLKKMGAVIGLDPYLTIASERQLAVLARGLVRKLVYEPDHISILSSMTANRLVKRLREYSNQRLLIASLRAPSEQDWQHLKKLLCAEVLAEVQIILPISLETSEPTEAWLEFQAQLKNLQLLAQNNSWSEICAALDSINKPRKKRGEDWPEMENAWESFKKQREKWLTPTLNPQSWSEQEKTQTQFFKLAEIFHQKWLELKNQQGLIEMQDLEARTCDLIKEHPDLAQIFSEGWDYWLIDEFQDTSPVQENVLQNLIGEKPYFVVGDPQQSIYLFRGARSEVFAQKRENVLAQKGEVVPLTTNYRSEPELLHAINDVFTSLQSEEEQCFQPMQARASEDLDPTKVVVTYSIADEDAELDSIAQHMSQLIQSGVLPQDICVLARKNSDLVKTATHLTKFGIPTTVHAASGFYDRREVLDALAFLKFLVNPHDNLNILCLLRSPYFKVSDQEIIQWVEELKLNDSYWAAFLINPKINVSTVIVRLHEWLQMAKQVGYLQTLLTAYRREGFIDLSQYLDPTGRREANLWKLVAQLREQMQSASFNILDFIETGHLAGASENQNDATPVAEPRRVNLMTVHASKGLQFDYVFVPFMHKAHRSKILQSKELVLDEVYHYLSVPCFDEANQKEMDCALSLPTKWTFLKREKQELARLFYVALTRAKKHIYMSWEKKIARGSWASMLNAIPSPGLSQTSQYSVLCTEGPWQPLSLVSEGRDAAELKLIPWQKNQNVESRNVRQVILEPFNNKQIKAMATGTILHKLFELLQTSESMDVHGFLERWFPQDKERIYDALLYVLNLQEPPFKKLLSHGFTEWRFVVREPMLTEGRIDLWGIDTTTKTVWIIDYKSGESMRINDAFMQLQKYEQALRVAQQIRSDYEVQAAVIYPFLKKTIIQKLATIRS